MFNLEEYNEVFDCNLNKESFEAVMGKPISIKDADELIFVDPDTHEKIVFKRIKDGE